MKNCDTCAFQNLALDDNPCDTCYGSDPHSPSNWTAKPSIDDWIEKDREMNEPQGALKFDGDKPRLDLIPTAPLLGIGRVLGFGAQKYAAHNWRNGFEYSRLIGAALRHVTSYNDGEDLDPESKLCHIDHALCTLMFLREQIAKGTGTDDRYKPKGSPEK